MNRTLISIVIFCLLTSCSPTKVSTGPSVELGPVEIGLHLNTDGEFELDGGVSIPILPIMGLGGVNWDIAFSTVLNNASSKENYLIVLWQDFDGSIMEQDFPIGQPFEINFEHDQWVRKIKRLENGSIVVFVEKQELARIPNPPINPTTLTDTFYDLPEDGEVLNRFCTDNWETCRDTPQANANWQDIDVASIGGGSFPDGYLIERTFLFFDTSSIPTSATIQSAILYIYAGQFLNGNTTIHIAKSNASIPLSTSSFQKFTNVSGGTTTLTLPFDWGSINLQDNALQWIIPGGTTKLVLIHDNDLKNVVPNEQNDVVIATGEDNAHRPYLEITYTIP